MGKGKLTFSETSESQGFVGGELAIADDRYPPAIIREVVQNSLDAAVHEGNRNKAEIEFCIDTLKTEDIPGIKEYREAIYHIEDGCKKAKKTLNDQEKGILDKIKNTLKKKNIPVLFITDNGVGLDFTKMNGILSNGKSEKLTDGAGGSRGNGHFATFALSNLRYLLYGGVSQINKEKQMLFSGHAILASQYATRRSHAGRYITEDGDMLENYKFCEPKYIPSFMKEKLKLIDESEHGTGSVICILGFDAFGNKSKEDILRIVFSSIAKNFFAAIHSGNLVVSFSDEKLDTQTLDKHLNCGDEHKKGKDTFPSQRDSIRYYELLKNLDPMILNLTTSNKESEKIYAYMNYHERSRSTLALTRNGMWITKDIPHLSGTYNFREYKSFDMLLTCDKDAEDLRRLLRIAENNTHTSISLDRISDDTKREKLEQILIALQEQIKNKIQQKPQGDEYENDIFILNIPGIAGNTLNPLPPRNPTSSHVDDEGTDVGPNGKRSGDGENTGGTQSKKSVKGNRIEIKRHAVTLIEEDKIMASFIPAKDYTNVRVSIEIPNGRDPTCDSPEGNDNLKVLNVKLNGNTLKKKERGYIIDDIGQDQKIVLEIKYQLSQEQINLKKHGCVECVLERIKEQKHKS